MSARRRLTFARRLIDQQRSSIEQLNDELHELTLRSAMAEAKLKLVTCLKSRHTDDEGYDLVRMADIEKIVNGGPQ